MRSSPLALGASLLLAASQTYAAITLKDRKMTYRFYRYYDMTAPKGNGGLCTKEGGQMATWNDWTYEWYTDGRPRRPACFTTLGEDYVSMNTNRIVSIPTDLLVSNTSLCGKEVKIYDPKGKELVFDEGSFFVYDACDACNKTNAVDFSVKAFAQMCGGHCGIGEDLTNPKGWTVEITDQTIWRSDADRTVLERSR